MMMQQRLASEVCELSRPKGVAVGLTRPSLWEIAVFGSSFRDQRDSGGGYVER